MQIVDDTKGSDRGPLSTVTLCLKVDEIEQLIVSLEDVLIAVKENPKDTHVHVFSEDYKKEIKLCAYGTGELNSSLHHSIISLIESEKKV